MNSLIMRVVNIDQGEKEWRNYQKFLARRLLKLGLSDVGELKLVDCAERRLRFGHGRPPPQQSEFVSSRKVPQAESNKVYESQVEDSSSGFDLMPNEILCKIFNYLQTIDQVPLRNVCRRWETVLKSPPCIESISVCPQTLVGPPVPEECLMFTLEKLVDRSQTKIVHLYDSRKCPFRQHHFSMMGKETDPYHAGDNILNFVLGTEPEAQEPSQDSVPVKGVLLRLCTVRFLQHSTFHIIRKIELSYGSADFHTLVQLPPNVAEVTFKEVNMTAVATLTSWGEYSYAVEVKQGEVVALSEDQRAKGLWCLAERYVKPLQRKQLKRLCDRIQVCYNFGLSDVIRGINEIIIKREEKKVCGNELVGQNNPLEVNVLTLKALTAVDINAFVRWKLDARGILGHH